MRMTKISAATLALALPVMSGAALGTAFAAEDASSAVKVAVALGKDGADADVTLNADGMPVGSQVADDSGNVSFDYTPTSEAAQLTITVDGDEEITINQAQCSGLAAGGDSADGADGGSAGTGGAGGAGGAGGNSNAGGGLDDLDFSGFGGGFGDGFGDGEGTDSDPKTDDDGQDETDENTEEDEEGGEGSEDDDKDGSGTPGAGSEETSAKIKHKLEKEGLTAKEISSLSSDIKALQKEANKPANKGGVAAAETKAEINSDADKLLKLLEGKEAEAKKTGKPVTFDAKETDLFDVLKPAISGVAGMAGIPPGLVDMGMDLVGNIFGGGGGGGLFGGGGSDDAGDLDSYDDVDYDDAGGFDDAGDLDGGSDDQAPSGDTTPDTTPAGNSGDIAPEPEKSFTHTEFTTTNTDDTITVTLDGMEVSAVNCSAEVDLEEFEDDYEPAQPSAPAPAPEAAPVSAPQVATPGPKVNTGGEAEAQSLFAKIKGLFA